MMSSAGQSNSSYRHQFSYRRRLRNPNSSELDLQELGWAVMGLDVKKCWTLVIQMFLKVHTPKNVHPVKFQYITMSILLSYRGFLLLYSIQNEIFTGYGSPNILQYLSVLLDNCEAIGTPATIRHLGRKLIDPAVVTIHFSIVFLFAPFKIF